MGAEYVFNLTADPTESTDVSKESAYTESIKQIINPTEVFEKDLCPDNSRTLCTSDGTT
jgi:hypothetical protein